MSSFLIAAIVVALPFLGGLLMFNNLPPAEEDPELEDTPIFLELVRKHGFDPLEERK